MESEQPLCPSAGSPVGEVKSVPEEEEVLGEESYACNQEVLERYSYTPVTVMPTGPDSLGTEEPFCRICHEGGGVGGEGGAGGAGGGELLSPCECSGTLATVHRACLERWLTAANSSRCELCLHQYAVERLTRPLGEWLSSPSTQHQRRTLCGDVVCFLFITPLASLSGWLCLQGALDLSYSNSLEAVGLLLLTLALFSIYLFWTLVSLRYHLQLVRTWRRTDQRVRLHLAPPAPAPPRAPQTGHQIISLNFLSKDASKETVV